MALSSPVDLLAPSGGGGTAPTISSSLGNVADQTGAYAPTLTVSGGTVLTTATNTSTGSVTVTGATTTTPSIPEPAAGSSTIVTHTATDGGLDGVIAFVVAKAGASGAAWATLADYDLTTVDNAGPWTTGDNTVTTDTGGTSLFDVVVVRNVSSGGSVSTVNGSGLVATNDGANSLGCGIRMKALLASLIGAWDRADAAGGLVCIQAAVIWVAGPSDFTIVGPVTTDDGYTECDAVRVEYGGANHAVKSKHDGAESSMGVTAGQFTDMVVTAYVVGGHMVSLVFSAGTLTLPSPTTGAGTYTGVDAEGYNFTERYVPAFNFGMLAGDDAVMTMSRLKISRYQ